MIGIGIRQSSPPGRRRGGNVAPTVTLTGLTSNPTYGATAQNGVELTAVPAGFPQGATFSYLWRTWENATSLATSATFTPDADAIDLDNVYCVVTPSVGDPVNSSAYVVRYAPPVAAGGIADQSWPEDDGITPLDLAADFTGSDITYALAPSSAALPAGLSLLAAGSITGTPTTPASSANIVVRGTNSGGSTDTAFGATVSAATVSISGLTTNPTYGETAEIGSHASIGASISSGTITSYRWGNAVSGTEYGTGSSPSDFSAGDGGTLHLEIVADGDTYNATATIRHAPPVAGSLGPVNETQGGGTPSVNLSAGFTGSDLTYSENAAWASISGSTLTINDEVRTDTLTITATNSGGAATVDLGVTISAAATSAITGLTNNAIYGTTAQVGVELTGTVSGTASGHAWTLDGAFISGATAATYTPVSGDDLGVLRYTPTVDGNLVLSTGYTVRQAPPVAGTLAPITETHGTGTPTVNVAAGFTGSSLIYTETVAWASISGSTLTINDEVRTDTLTITATNSGGAATVDLSVTIEATGDETAPVLSSISWDDGTDAASFTVSEGGTLIVATHDSAETLTPDGSGGWTGTVIETDSVAIAGEGPTNYTVSYTDASQNADRVSYYVRDGAGNDSAVQTELFTSNVASTSVRYMVAGAPTTDSLRVNIGTVAGATDVKVAYSTAANMAGSTSTAAISTDTVVLAATFDLPSLAADTLYYYQAKIDGVLTGPIQSARTLPDATGSIKIAFASCAERNDNGLAVFGQIAATSPHLMIGMGDTPYIDEIVDDQQVFRTKMQTWFSQYGVPSMMSTVPYAYTWSDHDYGHNGSYNVDTVSKPAAQAVYRQLQPHYPLAVAGSIYHAFNAGPARVIVMDLHSERDTGILMSPTQLTWVKDELTAAEADANVKMVMLVSSAPWVGTVSDGWSYASAQRIEINDHILNLGLENRLLMGNGDAHMLAYDDGTNNVHNTAGVPSFPVAVSAPLNRGNSVKGGPYTIGPFDTSNRQFTTMEAVPDGLGELTVTVTGYSDGTQTYQTTFTTANGNHTAAAPSTLNLSANTVQEDAATDAVIGTLTSNGGGTLTYTLTSDPSGNFKIVGDELQVAAGATLTETNTHNITAQVSNLNGSHSENFTITVSAASSSAGQVVQYKQSALNVGASSSVTLDTAPTSGNLLVLYCSPDKSILGDGTFTVPAGFTIVDQHGGSTSGEVSGVLCYKVSDGSETGALTTSWTGSRRVRTAIVELQGPIGTAPIVLSKGANKTEAAANSVTITGDASVTVNAVAVAFYSNDSQSNGANAAYTYTGGFLPIPGTDTYKNTGGGDQGAPLIIGGYKIITATETPSLTIGHDGSTDGSIGFMAAFKTA